MNESFSVKSYAFDLREKLKRILKSRILNQRDYAIASALLLGIKDSLDNELKSAYSSAGAMHVLAVSGLHVGIIYIVIIGLFGKLKNRKGGKCFLAFICLASLWSYAFITGLSPSVLRAVTMFTFIIIAPTVKRQTNIFNTLAASAFFYFGSILF